MKRITLAIWAVLLSTNAMAAGGNWAGGGIWTDNQGRQIGYEIQLKLEQDGQDGIVTTEGKWTDPDSKQTVQMKETFIKRFVDASNYQVYLIQEGKEVLSGSGECKVYETEKGSARNCRQQYRNAMGLLVDIEGLFCEKTQILSRRGTMGKGFSSHSFTEILVPVK